LKIIDESIKFPSVYVYVYTYTYVYTVAYDYAYVPIDVSVHASTINCQLPTIEKKNILHISMILVLMTNYQKKDYQFHFVR
jgi:hypothetical protein